MWLTVQSIDESQRKPSRPPLPSSPRRSANNRKLVISRAISVTRADFFRTILAGRINIFVRSLASRLARKQDRVLSGSLSFQRVCICREDVENNAKGKNHVYAAARKRNERFELSLSVISESECLGDEKQTKESLKISTVNDVKC